MKFKMSDKANAVEYFQRLMDILEKLRAPGGCPWDQEQTSKSLIPFLLEETYEVIEAIEDGDLETLKEELGDLTLHILFQAQIAKENKQFDISDSLENICSKLIQRHSHVFNPDENTKQDGSIKNWEFQKQNEKKRKYFLDGVPKKLPALTRAWRIQKKAATVGFDWPEIHPVWDKVKEELDELDQACESGDFESIKDELGDVLFSIVNLGRFLDINSEEALRKTISKFETRFAGVEKRLKNKGKTLEDSTLEEMDELWELEK